MLASHTTSPKSHSFTTVCVVTTPERLELCSWKGSSTTNAARVGVCCVIGVYTLTSSTAPVVTCRT